MQSKPKVVIGIPAYNEAGNIGHLLEALLKQKAENYLLEQIIVANDGSSDNTVEIVQSFSNPKIQVFNDNQRLGPAKRQNQILESCQADVLVLLNGDIALEGDKFLDNLVSRVVDGGDMVATRMGTMEPISYFESIFTHSEKMKREMYEMYNAGNNVYTCHGAARAFSKKFYQSFRFSGSVGEDAYSYFYVLENNLQYIYTKDATFYIRAVGTLRDHLKQSTRHMNTIPKLKKEFPNANVVKEYRIPLSVKIKGMARAFFRSPVRTTVYVGIFLGSILASYFIKPNEAYSVSTSTKVLYK